MGLAEREDRDWLNAARCFFNSYKDAPDFDVLLRELLRLSLANDVSFGRAEDASSGNAANSSSGNAADAPGADLLEDCLTAVLPLCKAPEVENFLGLYCTVADPAPDAPRTSHFMNACNAAQRELQDLQISSHRFKDAANIQMQPSGCANYSRCKGMMPDAVLVAKALGEEVAVNPTDMAQAPTDANAKTVPKGANTDPVDALASIFFCFKPSNSSTDTAPEYTTKECTTQRRSKVNALRELDTYSVGGVCAHASTQRGRQLNMRMGKVAAQVLAASPEMLWTMSLLILDSKALVCCIDRQGIMHLSGIDIIDDLPRFLLLLFALQRLPRGMMSVGNGEHLGAVRAENRGLQTVTAEHLQPMVKLTSEPKEFVKGFFQITEAHYKAWINGVKHGDPTLDNMLYRKA
ncbi:uncharacterized protein SCHCODRAFT_02686936 [Schizophyllum commune H4-8]|nr:uncharacterized protein SCHCODRAFT_02686936 [Schizophyllum commune H4-8]KAI5895570.1 hypothetical protein SCHCODRAFT_02686936 [Schizophyllum commune H4-8]